MWTQGGCQNPEMPTQQAVEVCLAIRLGTRPGLRPPALCLASYEATQGSLDLSQQILTGDLLAISLAHSTYLRAVQ